MKSLKQKLELSELFLKTLDGSIDAEEFEKVDNLLRKDRQILEYYAEFLTMYSNLRKPGNIFAETVHGDEEVSPLTDQILWKLLAENERTAKVLDLPSQNEISKVNIYPLKRSVPAQRPRVSRIALYTAIFSTAALLMFIVYAIFNPRVNPVIAKITDTIDACWEGTTDQLGEGSDIHPGPMKLVKGFALVTLDSGVEILLQAPSSIILETAEQVFLEVGKLSVNIQTGQAGFVVRTPLATVVDYGTEFGVAVDQQGQTETAVFKGKVELRTGSNPLVFEKAQRLNAGQAALVDNAGRFSLKQGETKDYARSMTDIRQSEGMLGRNLIVNGDFEQNFVASNPDFADFENMAVNVVIEGWEDNCAATVIPYEVMGGTDMDAHERNTARLPDNRGRYYFAGVENCTVSQRIDVSALACRINNDTVLYELSGSLGGWREHSDPVEVVVKFVNDKGKNIGSSKIRLDDPEERNYRTGFLRCSKTGVVPKDTAELLIEINCFENIGLSDSYADNLSIVLYE